MSKNNQPKVTVYVTNYNYDRFIEEAVNSVLEQSFQDFELLIIDDGSTDQSKTIIEQWENHPKVRTIFQQNKGLNATNNVALKEAKGAYLMRLDADDFLAPNALALMVEAFEKDQELGLVFPDYYYVNAQGEVISEMQRHDFNSEVNLLDQPAHGACTMIRVAYLNEVGGYDESYKCQDGYELWIKFSTKFKVTNLQEPLFYYRQHGSNLTSNELKILTTRQQINKDFIVSNQVAVPKCVGIIPVRGSKLNGVLLPFVEVGKKKLIDLKIEAALKSSYLEQIVITTSVQEVIEYVQSKYQYEKRVLPMQRPAALSGANVSLVGTVQQALAQLNEAYSFFIVLPIEYPFLTERTIDDAMHATVIFKTDSLISVRPEHNTMYQHHGSGMVPILNQDKFTKLEREALYRNSGGIFVSNIAQFKEQQKLLLGKVGHVVVDKKSAIGIFSNFELELANLLANN